MTAGYLPVKYTALKEKRIVFRGLERIGRHVTDMYRCTIEMLNFLGFCLIGCVAIIFHPTRIFPAVVSSAEKTGISAIPIIVVTSSVVGAVLAYESAI